MIHWQSPTAVIGAGSDQVEKHGESNANSRRTSHAERRRGDRGQSAGIPATAPRLPAWWGIAVVLALTFAVYIPTLRYQFVHDDRGQIVENPAVHSWHAVPTYFTAQVWAAVMPEELGNYYRPLFLLWLRINDVVFGNQAWGWHLTTILAHVLTTLLVYLLAWRLGIGRDVALLAALIFGLHPAHIEAVAWISGVTEPLLGIFLDCLAPCLPSVARRGSARAQMESHFPGVVCSRHAGERDRTDTSRPSACLRMDLWGGVGKTARGEENSHVVRRGARQNLALLSSRRPLCSRADLRPERVQSRGDAAQHGAVDLYLAVAHGVLDSPPDLAGRPQHLL